MPYYPGAAFLKTGVYTTTSASYSSFDDYNCKLPFSSCLRCVEAETIRNAYLKSAYGNSCMRYEIGCDNVGNSSVGLFSYYACYISDYYIDTSWIRLWFLPFSSGMFCGNCYSVCVLGCVCTNGAHHYCIGTNPNFCTACCWLSYCICSPGVTTCFLFCYPSKAIYVNGTFLGNCDWLVFQHTPCGTPRFTYVCFYPYCIYRVSGDVKILCEIDFDKLFG